MSQPVRLEGKHTAQTAHCAMLSSICLLMINTKMINLCTMCPPNLSILLIPGHCGRQSAENLFLFHFQAGPQQIGSRFTSKISFLASKISLDIFQHSCSGYTSKICNQVFFSTFASNISYVQSKMRLLLLYLTSFSCFVSSTPLSGNVGSGFSIFVGPLPGPTMKCVCPVHPYLIFVTNPTNMFV